MKKIIKALALVLMIIPCLLILTSCGDKKYTITYMLDGYVYTEYETKGNEVIDIPSISYAGYEFSGWFIDENHTTEFTINTYLNKSLDKNIIIYGETSPIKYTINYNLGASEINNALNPESFYVDSLTIELKEATKEGFRFVGWYNSPNGEGSKVTKINTGTTENISIYPYFEQEYNITYVVDESDVSKNILDTYTKNDRELLIPSKDGYDFLGWFTENSYTTQLTEISETSTQNYVLYAKWQQSIFELNDNYITGLTEYGETLSEITIPRIIMRNGEKHIIHSIDRNAFRGCGFTKVVIEDGVEVIKERAFSYCTELRTIEIPSTVWYIYQYAFSNCPKLSIVTLEGVKVIRDFAFADCENLTAIIIGKEIVQIDEGLLSDSDNAIIYMKDRYMECEINDSDWRDYTIYYYSAIYQEGCWHYDSDGVTPVLW